MMIIMILSNGHDSHKLMTNRNAATTNTNPHVVLQCSL